MKPRQSRGASSAHPEKKSAASPKGKREGDVGGRVGRRWQGGPIGGRSWKGPPRESLPTEASSLPSNNKGRRTHAREQRTRVGNGVGFLRPADSQFHGDPSRLPGWDDERAPSLSGRIPASLPRRWRKGSFGCGGGGRRSRRQAPRVHRLPLTGGSLLSSPLFAAPPALPAGAEEVNRKVRVSPSHSFFSLALSPATATLNSDSPGSDAPARTTHVQRSGQQQQQQQ